MTTSDYLEQLQQDKQDLVDNLTEKGIEGLTGDETFTELVPQVLDIPSGGGGANEYFTSNIPNGSSSTPGWVKTVKKLPAFTGSSINYAFSQFQGTEIDLSNITQKYSTIEGAFKQTVNLTKLDLRNLDTSTVDNMSYTFQQCGNENTQILVGDKFDTSKVTNMSYMFQSFHGGHIDLTIFPNFNTSNVTNMSGMFGSCKSVIFPSVFNIEKVTNMQYMFDWCTIPELDISVFGNAPALQNVSYMFRSCTSTTKIDMRNFDFSHATSYTNMFGASATQGVPNNCLIIVKNDTLKNWITSKFSRLTNVKTVDELGE